MRLHHIFGVFALMLIVAACSEGEKKSEKEIEEEKFPKINKADYSTEKSELGYSFLVPQYMSPISGSGKSDLRFNHISKERHVSVIVTPVSAYKKSVNARAMLGGKQKKLFELFVDEQLEDFKGSRKVLFASELKSTVFKQIPNYSIELDVKEYGFPKEKSYFIRWKASKQNFYTIICWTTKEQKEQFRTEARAIGLSLEE